MGLPMIQNTITNNKYEYFFMINLSLKIAAASKCFQLIFDTVVVIGKMAIFVQHRSRQCMQVDVGSAHSDFIGKNLDITYTN